MNYAEHTRELHGEGVHNEEPVIFMKPDSAVIQKGKPFFLPDYSKRVDYETELVVRICRLGKNIQFKDLQDLHFHLDIDGKTVQKGYTGDMLFKIDEIITYVSQFMTLKIGDLLFTGTPVGVGPVSLDQHLEGYLEGQKLLDFYIR